MCLIIKRENGPVTCTTKTLQKHHVTTHKILTSYPLTEILYKCKMLHSGAVTQKNCTENFRSTEYYTADLTKDSTTSREFAKHS